MREDDEYQGVRCKLVATLGKAQIPFALDLSFGDPKHAQSSSWSQSSTSRQSGYGPIRCR